MESTVVSVAGPGTNPKTTLYVGGLEESVSESILHAAFVPFGEIKDVTIPLDHTSGKHRGFGFVEYEDREDAGDAIDNLNNAEVYGKVLKVNYAQPIRIKGGDKGWSHQPVWADTDKYLEEQRADQEWQELEKEQRKKRQEKMDAMETENEGEAKVKSDGEGNVEKEGDPMKSLEQEMDES
ncbi:hypothetical protein BSKO_08322 [Bryopsis sp. KO-2023]|nr:hypothetical protein BSKO_08322 [Bryopsis sp. KO-2023]